MQGNVNARWGGTEILGALKAVFDVPVSKGETLPQFPVRGTEVAARVHQHTESEGVRRSCQMVYKIAGHPCRRLGLWRLDLRTVCHDSCDVDILLSLAAGHQREIIFCTDGGVSGMEEDRIKSLVKTGSSCRLAPVVKVRASFRLFTLTSCMQAPGKNRQQRPPCARRQCV